MKILIDINHPAHVHYFKNMIKIMENKGHQFLIISRNKEIEHYLLKKYDIPFFDRGKGENRLIGKTFYFFKALFLILKEAKKFKTDVIISFGTPYPAIASCLLKIPHISVNDTEHARLHHLLTDPFSKCILTPSCYNKDLGKKQIRFNGYMELCYLHSKYFMPDPSIFDLLGVNKDEKYVIFRFVSWNASHDVGHSGLSLEMKRKAVNEFSKYAKVFISSEGELPNGLDEFKIKIPPEKMHDALYYASMLYGESATMASECAVLGTPAIYLDNVGRGYTDEQENKYGLVFNYSESLEDQEKSIRKGVELFQNSNLKQESQKRRQKMLSEKIDVSAFMVWFVENYPQSKIIMKSNQDYQHNFR